MDIKLNQLKNKKSAWLFGAVAVICIFLLSLGVVAGYPKFYEHSKTWYPDYENTHKQDTLADEDWLLRVLSAKNYTFGNQSELITESLFSGFNEYFINNYIYRYDLCYIVTDTSNDTILETEGTHYTPAIDGFDSYTDYDLKITFSYDEKGRLSISDFDGFRSLSAEYPVKLFKTQAADILNLLYEYSDGYDNITDRTWSSEEYAEELQKNVSLKNLEITYLIPPNCFFDDYNNSYYKGAWSLEQSGILLFFAGFFLLTFLLGCFLPIKALRFPAELSAFGAFISLMFTMDSGFTYMLYSFLSGETAASILDGMHLSNVSEDTINLFLNGSNVFLWFAMGAVTFLFGHSLRLFFVYKPKNWFFTCTLTGRFLSFIKNLVCRLGNWLFSLLRAVDFSDDLDKKLLKLVGIQFLIIGLLSLTWFFGTFCLLIYSVFLFFFLKKYALDLKKKYRVLLSAADEMAEGNLNISIEEDLGLFSSLGTAISRIQQGFKKAVEEETKSQQMKTELITNVSHDLKTPLTAIITYVNLLKEEGLTEEERRSYIDTLDKKSLRLKQLIEDLFEVSKANSNNITLHPVEVDLNALIKQAALELEDKISASQIDFRYQLPSEKVLLTLDSEKTYRIIENLMVNITKYALPGSRAYIELAEDEQKVVLTMKNISAQELTFSTEEITNRFVRGDKSRSTEGSGLGLAIVKSFTELQGGNLQLSTDGDLFKVQIEFYK